MLFSKAFVCFYDTRSLSLNKDARQGWSFCFSQDCGYFPEPFTIIGEACVSFSFSETLSRHLIYSINQATATTQEKSYCPSCVG